MVCPSPPQSLKDRRDHRDHRDRRGRLDRKGRRGHRGRPAVGRWVHVGLKACAGTKETPGRRGNKVSKATRVLKDHKARPVQQPPSVQPALLGRRYLWACTFRTA